MTHHPGSNEVSTPPPRRSNSVGQSEFLARERLSELHTLALQGDQDARDALWRLREEFLLPIAAE